jgi:transposase
VSSATFDARSRRNSSALLTESLRGGMIQPLIDVELSGRRRKFVIRQEYVAVVELGGVSRRSSDPIELSEDERRELEAIAGRLMAPFRMVQRARIVLYAAQGLTNVEIARRLDTAPEVVAKWRRRFRLERLEGLQDRARSGRPRRFSPQEVAQVKAVACELPREAGVPLSRFSRAELHRLVIERAVCDASASTIARWLAEDALRPWQHRSWSFPRDPRFLERAGPVLDLYERRWQGELLHPGDLVICADEKTQIQARAGFQAVGADVHLAGPAESTSLQCRSSSETLLVVAQVRLATVSGADLSDVLCGVRGDRRGPWGRESHP